LLAFAKAFRSEMLELGLNQAIPPRWRSSTSSGANRSITLYNNQAALEGQLVRWRPPCRVVMRLLDDSNIHAHTTCSAIEIGAVR